MPDQIVNEFTVNRPIDEAWPIICDVEQIAPCLPGAQLEEIEGDVYRGRVKVKLGAVATEFSGEAQFVERDDDAHRAKLVAKGRDTKGRGNASADISAEAVELSSAETRCVVTADLHITGKVAQFGRGIMGDVSKKLIDQFAANLNTMLDEQPAAGGDEIPVATGDGVARGASSPDTAATAEWSQQPTIRRIAGPPTRPADLAGLAGPAVLKRLVPAVVMIVVVFLILRRRR